MDRSGPRSRSWPDRGRDRRGASCQNVQVAAGTVGQPPFDTGSAYQLNVETQGRFVTPQQFAKVVIRADANGGIVRLSDVARVELGAEDYGVNAYLSARTR
jgi:multidrug efflux pump subunit AcrB